MRCQTKYGSPGAAETRAASNSARSSNVRATIAAARERERASYGAIARLAGAPAAARRHNELTVHPYFDSNLSWTIRRKCGSTAGEPRVAAFRKLAKLDEGGELAGSRGG